MSRFANDRARTLECIFAAVTLNTLQWNSNLIVTGRRSQSHPHPLTRCAYLLHCVRWNAVEHDCVTEEQSHLILDGFVRKLLRTDKYIGDIDQLRDLGEKRK